MNQSFFKTSMEECKQVEIISNEKISHDIIHLIVTNPFLETDFIVSSFLFIYKSNLITDTNEEVIKRPYTPVNITNDVIEFRIKIYEKGQLTKYLENKKPKDLLKISKPIQKKEYIKNQFSDVYMIAGGTGITPMFQILQYVAKTPNENKTNFVLFFCNKTKEDIFLKNELKKIQEILKGSLKIVYIVTEEEYDNSYDKSNYETGIINQNLLEKYSIKELQKKQKILIYVCGPPGFMETVSGDKTVDKEQGELTGILDALGFSKSQVYKF